MVLREMLLLVDSARHWVGGFILVTMLISWGGAGVCHVFVELHNKATLMPDLFLADMNFVPCAVEITLVTTDNHETGISSQVSCNTSAIYYLTCLESVTNAHLTVTNCMKQASRVQCKQSNETTSVKSALCINRARSSSARNLNNICITKSKNGGVARGVLGCPWPPLL